jgi:hypothetical protein
MLRIRLVLLVTMAALVAPWVAPCLVTAPAGHPVMPCCQSAYAGTPAARPCCAASESQPSTSASSQASLTPGAQLFATAIAFAPVARPQSERATATHLFPVRARVLSSVLLI